MAKELMAAARQYSDMDGIDTGEDRARRRKIV